MCKVWTIVTAAVIEENGRILIARRRAGGPHGGKWEFPGGKLEPGETPRECLRRELHEELAIDARVGELLCATEHVYSHMAIKLLVYSVFHVSGEVTLKEHDELRWVMAAELAGYDFPEADLPVVALLTGCSL